MRYRKLFLNLSLALGFQAVAATLTPLIEHEAWWIRIFDFPRFQIMVVALIALLLYAFCCRPATLCQYLFLGAISLSMLYQAFNILPYTPLAPITVKYSDSPHDSLNHISILVTNVYMENREANQCLQIIREADPDLVLAVETDAWWQEQLAELEKEYPYQAHHPLPNTYGMLLYSRLPLHQTQVNFLVQDDVPSVHTFVELPSGERVQFYGLHPRPPAPQESKSSLPRDAELIMVGKQVHLSQAPTIVAGDMNDVAWSHTTKLFREISGLLDPRRGRGLYNTFNAKYPLFRWPLDHVFHSEHFRLLELRRLPHIGSDHFPIFARLSYEPEQKHLQEKPKPEEEDLEDAAEKLEKVEEER